MSATEDFLAAEMEKAAIGEKKPSIGSSSKRTSVSSCQRSREHKCPHHCCNVMVPVYYPIQVFAGGLPWGSHSSPIPYCSPHGGVPPNYCPFNCHISRSCQHYEKAIERKSLTNVAAPCSSQCKCCTEKKCPCCKSGKECGKSDDEESVKSDKSDKSEEVEEDED